MDAHQEMISALRGDEPACPMCRGVGSYGQPPKTCEFCKIHTLPWRAGDPVFTVIVPDGRRFTGGSAHDAANAANRVLDDERPLEEKARRAAALAELQARSDAQMAADYAHLNCPACGGSGHVDDVHGLAADLLALWPDLRMLVDGFTVNSAWNDEWDARVRQRMIDFGIKHLAALMTPNVRHNALAEGKSR